MTAAIQRSFARGEFSLASRVDLAQYFQGLDTMRNMVTPVEGGAEPRPGFIYCGSTKNPANESRLIPFVFSDQAAFILEVGATYIRIWADSAQVLSGGVAVEVTTPYAQDDIWAIDYAQDGALMVLTHPSYPPYQLVATDASTWSFSRLPFKPSQVSQGTVTGAVGGAGSNTYEYIAVKVNSRGYQSAPCAKTPVVASVSAVTNANPGVVAAASHGLSNGDPVTLGSTIAELDGRLLYVANKTANTFQLADSKGNLIDTTNMSAFVSTPGSGVYHATLKLTSAAAPSASAPNTITVPNTQGDADYFEVYLKDASGVFGFIGKAPIGGTFADPGITPDPTENPPNTDPQFYTTGNFPSVCAFYQQRLLLGGTINDPSLVVTSRTGDYNDFSTHVSVRADDSVQFEVATTQSLRFLAQLRRLLALFSSSEYAILGDDTGALTPTTINSLVQSDHGVAQVKPVLADGYLIFNQNEGAILRDFKYNFATDAWEGIDLTLFSRHLFKGHTIVQMAWQQMPNAILWVLRDDGVLLGLTYIKAEQVLAWHRHDTDGTFESIAVIPEGNERALYAVVKRTINGSTARYVERQANALWTDRVDAIYLDACLTYDGRSTDGSTMTLTGGTTWKNTETLTLTASAAKFQPEDTGNEIWLTGADGEKVRFGIETFSSTTVVTGKAKKTVPTSLRATATDTWAKAVDQLLGLDHLVAKEVEVIGDGFVVANPLDPTITAVTVQSDGRIDLPRCYSVLHVGLPYARDLKTLPIDDPQGQTFLGKPFLISELGARLRDSGSFWAGTDFPDDDSADGMAENKLRDQEAMDDPIDLFTGVVTLKIAGKWKNDGQVCLRSINATPWNVLAIAPAGNFPDGGRA